MSYPHSSPPSFNLNRKGLFLVWAFPQGSHRSQLIAQELGIPVEHVYLTSRQGQFYALLKYPFQTLKTFLVLWRHRPQLVFVQSPPIFGALLVYLWGLVTGTKFIIDSHTDALLAHWWAWTLPLHRYLSRRAVATIVTNNHLQQMIEDWGGKGFVLADPPATFGRPAVVNLPADKFQVVFVSTASGDEPVNEVLEAARQLPQVQFHVTGNYAKSRHHATAPATAPANVRFTGYLPDEDYFGLLAVAGAVISLTTVDHTIQSGAGEALWLGRPIITSDWPLLRQYFNRGTLHVNNTAAEIGQAILTIQANHARYEADVLALQKERRQEWGARMQTLLNMIP